jgi:hypothetical protein
MAISRTCSIVFPEIMAQQLQTSSKSFIWGTNGKAGVKVVGVLSTVVGIVTAAMEAPAKGEKEARSNACLVASDISGRSEGKFEAKSGQIPADLLRRALRRERRAENRYLAVFSVVSSFYQGQITPRQPNNFGQAGENMPIQPKDCQIMAIIAINVQSAETR